MTARRAKNTPAAKKPAVRVLARDTLLIDVAGHRVARGIITAVDSDYPPAVTLDGDVFLFVGAEEPNRLTYQQARVFRCGRDFQ